MGKIFSATTWADIVAAAMAIILTIVLGVLAIKGSNIPNEFVAFLTLIAGYLFRGAQTPVANGIAAATGNGAKP